MEKLRLILVMLSVLAVTGCSILRTTQTDGGPSYSPEEVQTTITQKLVNMRPPIADIYYYGMYQWQLTSHEFKEIRYVGDGEWEVISHATFNGFHRGRSVGTDRCVLRWNFKERTRAVELVGNELLQPDGPPPTFSRAEVMDIVGDHISDIYYDNPPLNWHDASHWKLNYLGNGKWEVRLVITNAVGLWTFDEQSETVRFVERLGP